MTDKLPRGIVADLNKMQWAAVARDNSGRPYPEGKLYAGWCGYDEAQRLIDKIAATGTGIEARHASVRREFGMDSALCISFAPSQLQALADSGVRFARKALQPGVISEGAGRDL